MRRPRSLLQICSTNSRIEDVTKTWCKRKCPLHETSAKVHYNMQKHNIDRDKAVELAHRWTWHVNDNHLQQSVVEVEKAGSLQSERTPAPSIIICRVAKLPGGFGSHGAFTSLSLTCHLSVQVLNGHPFILVGVSNGVAVVMELALRHRPRAIWLASGVPAAVSLLSGP